MEIEAMRRKVEILEGLEVPGAFRNVLKES